MALGAGTPTPEYRVNESYDCEESGHIMGPWYAKTGMPKPVDYRNCMVCRSAHQERTAPIAPSQ